ncbi:hypothetical protein HDV63DRAFT_388504 [Trichoderma sp. SZMC 28014]
MAPCTAFMVRMTSDSPFSSSLPTHNLSLSSSIHQSITLTAKENHWPCSTETPHRALPVRFMAFLRGMVGNRRLIRRKSRRVNFGRDATEGVSGGKLEPQVHQYTRLEPLQT